MSTIDLILLGLLYEQDYSAYDIHKQIQYRNLDRWVKISVPSIYKKVISLENKGYLSIYTQKESNMAEKAMYTITSSGRDYFVELMGKTAQAPSRLFFDFNGVIANLNKLPKDKALDHIAIIKKNIREHMVFMQKVQPDRNHIPLVGRTIIKQQLMVYHALSTWIEEFEAEFTLYGTEKTGPRP